jgi:hypothetical protein
VAFMQSPDRVNVICSCILSNYLHVRLFTANLKNAPL